MRHGAHAEEDAHLSAEIERVLRWDWAGFALLVAVIIGLFFVVGCAHAPTRVVNVPVPVVRIAPPMEQLARIVEITTTDGDGCHATPIGIVQLLTAYHCAGSGVIRFRAPHGVEGTAREIWHDTKRDLSMFGADQPPGWDVVMISAVAPELMSDLFWRSYIPGRKSVSVRGEFIGTDLDGDMTLVGFVTPGASGSGVLNAAGELVGVVHAAYNTLTLSDNVGGRDWTLPALVSELETAVKFSPAGVATPIRSWPEPPK